jgi:outer membrane immunogenic protein
MKNLLLGTIGLVAVSASAMAADLPAQTYSPPPPIVASIYDWTGFYIGAMADGDLVATAGALSRQVG